MRNLFDKKFFFVYIIQKYKQYLIEAMSKKRTRFRIEDDWLSFYIGVILGLLVLLGIIKKVPW